MARAGTQAAAEEATGVTIMPADSRNRIMISSVDGAPLPPQVTLGRARKLSCARKSNRCWAVCGKALRERLIGGRDSVVS